MKSILLYLLLVGGPLAVLVGILNAGSRVQAPRAIGGAWRVEAPAPSADSILEVSQSGVHLMVRHAGVQMRGELRGDSLLAAGDGDRRAAGPCDPRAGAVLRARVDSAARRMRATFSASSGGACAPVELVAARIPASRRERGH